MVKKQRPRLSNLSMEVYERIGEMMARGQEKKMAFQDISCEAFAARFPSDGHLTTEGCTLAREILDGGLSLAEESFWDLQKAANHLVRGIFRGMGRSGQDFLLGAQAVLWSAIMSSLQNGYKVCPVSRGVIGGILKHGLEVGCKMNVLTRMITGVVSEAAKYLTDEDLRTMERMLLDLLEEEILCLDEECQGRGNRVPPGEKSPGRSLTY